MSGDNQAFRCVFMNMSLQLWLMPLEQRIRSMSKWGIAYSITLNTECNLWSQQTHRFIRYYSDASTMNTASKHRQQKSPSTIPAALRLLPDTELALTGWRTRIFPSLVIFLFTPRPGICESIQRASPGLPVGIWMMNVRVKLSIFHIHNSPHTTRPRAAVIGSETPRRLRRPVKKNTHIWMRPRATGALWKHRITHRNWTDMAGRRISKGPFKCSFLFIVAEDSNRVTFAETMFSDTSV